MASSQKQHYEHGLKNPSFKTFRTTSDPFCRRKIKTDDLKISVRPELGALSRREISDVRQKMGAVNYESVIISSKVSKGGLHSILFDNINNKGKKQILGVILDTCSHFIRKRSRNSRYITFSSGLNEPGSFNQNENCETCISDGGHSSFSGFRFKKINISFAALLVFAMCFFVSCGDSAKQVNVNGDSVSNFGKLGGECYPNETCDKGLLCDTENNICIEDPDNPTDTEQNEHDNNHDINDNQWEQPDENHPETPDEQNAPDNQWEQGDEDHQDIPDEQNDQDNNEIPDNEGKCDPGYVWADYNRDPWLNDPEIGINDGKDYNNQCAPCTSINWAINKETEIYCPGGNISDLKNKSVKFQIEFCPSYETSKNDLSGCYCSYGVPPPGKTCADLYYGWTRKPLIINPKVNVIPDQKNLK